MVRLPSGETAQRSDRMLRFIGQVSNTDHENVNVGKAGKTRHKGIRPTVRGSVMNRMTIRTVVAKVNRRSAVRDRFRRGANRLWGYKTRKKHSSSDKFIVRRRNAK